MRIRSCSGDKAPLDMHVFDDDGPRFSRIFSKAHMHVLRGAFVRRGAKISNV